MADSTDNTQKVTTEIKSEILSTVPPTISNAESSIFGISIRGLVCILLVLAVILYPFFKIESQTVATLAVAAVSYYFGKMQSK